MDALELGKVVERRLLLLSVEKPLRCGVMDYKLGPSPSLMNECVEGVLRLTNSDFREPANIGSDEMVSMDEMAEIILSFEGKKLPIQPIPGPEGVRGRNSDNTRIKEKLGWAPTMKLMDGLRITYFWIKEQLEKEKAQGTNQSGYGSSKVVGTQATVQMGSLRAADGKECWLSHDSI